MQYFELGDEAKTQSIFNDSAESNLVSAIFMLVIACPYISQRETFQGAVISSISIVFLVWE
jgi:hypothetical protein